MRAHKLEGALNDFKFVSHFVLSKWSTQISSVLELFTNYVLVKIALFVCKSQ